MIKRAFISVDNPDGIVDFVRMLEGQGVKILSEGVTLGLIQDNGIQVKDVSDYTGEKPIFKDHLNALHFSSNSSGSKKNDGLAGIDLIIANVQPFEKMVRSKEMTLREAMNGVDIERMTLLMAAAKQIEQITVVIDPNDYDRVSGEIKQLGEVSLPLKEELAKKVFELHFYYDGLIADTLNGGATLHFSLRKIEDLLYGENPHQRASINKQMGVQSHLLVVKTRKIQGAQLSYNNFLDINVGLAIVRELEEPCAAFITHENPYGAAIGSNLEEAFDKGCECDIRCTPGSLVALNDTCTSAIAKKIIDRDFGLVVCPDFDEEALKLFHGKPNIKLLATGKLFPAIPTKRFRHIYGGMLMQEVNHIKVKSENLKCVTETQPTPEQIKDLLFAWHVVRFVKSNAIVVVKDGATVGIGAGQTSRIDAVEWALDKGGGREEGGVLASEAFFPFVYGTQEAAKHGIKAIIHTGGAEKDPEVIAEANKHGIAMVVTGVRAFLH